MLRPEWKGIYDCKKGLYKSNSKTNSVSHIENNLIDSKIETEKTEDKQDTNVNNNAAIYTINLNIPYYNEKLEYLKNNTDNNKYDNNYYTLLDKIGYISRYILKGYDYYKLYISKNANKYFSNVDNSISENTIIDNSISENTIIDNSIVDNSISENTVDKSFDNIFTENRKQKFSKLNTN